MELDLLLNYSNFIKNNQHIFSNLKKENLRKDSVLRYFNSELPKYFDSKSKNYENFQNLKNEIILLVFIAHYVGINDHLSSTRLWSIIMKKYLSRIFNHYLSLKYNNYKNFFFIIALGKLGVKDLNYSSDIDLIIIFDSKKSTIPIRDFDKTIKEILSKVSNSSNSFFHKIDMRLRPDFGNEFIVSDYENSIDYYSSVGRNWERLAFHRSCFLCGSHSLYIDFKNSINGFLYRQTFDFYAIDEIKKLFKFSQNHDSKINIKSSSGYIRTCENIVHFLQLLWSGKIKKLRNISIHKLFKVLESNQNIIKKEDIFLIKKAYYYYRWIEDLLHIKHNSKQNVISLENHDLAQFDSNFDIKILEFSKNIKNIFDKLFIDIHINPSFKIDNFNTNSRDIIQTWFNKSKNKIASGQIKKDFDNIINAYLNIVYQLEKRDELIIKFDFLLTYYKSGIHLAALYKYNNRIINELVFIFSNSTKLTNQLNKYNFLVETLVYYFNHGSDHLITKIIYKKDFDIDLKNLINSLYESLFLFDYLFLKEKISFNSYQFQRSRNIRSFIFQLFTLVKNFYIKDNKLINTDIFPVLYGSTALFQNLSYSDSDIFFIKMDNNISHLDSIKIVKRFYLIINQYLDKKMVNIDYRNKPFGNNSEIIISYEDFIKFYKNNNDDFNKFSFYKCDLITNILKYKKDFFYNKKKIISTFNNVNPVYLDKMIKVKTTSLDLKSVITIYDLLLIFDKINNSEKFNIINDLIFLKRSLNEEDLKNINTNIDLSFYIKKIKT